MKAMEQNLSGEVLRWQEKLFLRSVRRQTKLRQVKELLGATAGQDCMEVTAGDGMISQQLRLDGGTWTTLVPDDAVLESMQFFVKSGLRVLKDQTIDMPDQSVDAVVILDALERVADDHGFIRECHRVLRPDGRLIITTARKLPLGVGPIRALLGLSWKKRKLVRCGYTTREFFDVLKDGFDVPETISYSTCVVELPGMFCEAAANALVGGAYNMPPADADTEQFYHYTKLQFLGAIAYPWMWLMVRLDNVLNFILPGHNMAAKTKRRVWRERRTPILVDGRSIAEAALNTKIGTAAPF